MVFIGSLGIIIILSFFVLDMEHSVMYAQVSFMRIYYFMFMLLGAITAIDLTREDNNMIFSCLYRISSGVKSDEEVKRPYVSIKRSFALFFVSIVLYYVCMAIYKLGPFFCKFKIF